MSAPHRIAVLGPPGAGKSTLARRLGAALELPVHHLDRYFWRPGWVPTPKPEFARFCAELAAAERWVIDGNYSAGVPARLHRAELVLLLDPPWPVYLARILRRVSRDHGRETQAAGCPERFDPEFLRWSLGWSHRPHRRVRMLGQLAEHAGGARQYLLRSRGEIDAWWEQFGPLAR